MESSIALCCVKASSFAIYGGTCEAILMAAHYLTVMDKVFQPHNLIWFGWKPESFLEAFPLFLGFVCAVLRIQSP